MSAQLTYRRSVYWFLIILLFNTLVSESSYSQSAKKFWNIDQISAEEIPAEWRHLLPQCKSSLDDFFTGKASEYSRKLGLEESLLDLRMEVIQNPDIKVEEIMAVFFGQVKSDYPDT